MSDIKFVAVTCDRASCPPTEAGNYRLTLLRSQPSDFTGQFTGDATTIQFARVFADP